MRKNQGYTLIEMIIVVAIMAVMAGFAVITFGIVKKAKCNAAIDTFNNQLTSLAIKTKSLSQSKNQASPLDPSSDASTYPICMLVRRNDSSYTGTSPYPAYDSDARKKDAYIMYLGYYNSSGNFVVKEELGVLPRVIEIDYDKASEGQLHTLAKNGTSEIDKKHSAGSDDTTIDTFVIQFNKSDGSVMYGGGTYNFYVSGSQYGKVVLNSATGNHYTK